MRAMRRVRADLLAEVDSSERGHCDRARHHPGIRLIEGSAVSGSQVLAYDLAAVRVGRVFEPQPHAVRAEHVTETRQVCERGDRYRAHHAGSVGPDGRQHPDEQRTAEQSGTRTALPFRAALQRRALIGTDGQHP